MKKLKELAKILINIIYLPEIIFIFMIAKTKYKELSGSWIICERGDEAKDNGYKLFKYIVENKLKSNVYYIIDKNKSVDYDRVKGLGNIVQYKSYKHKILFILSENLISTHANTIIPWNKCKYNYFKIIYSWILKNKKYIFLQHGIIKDNLSNVLGKSKTGFDLFICGADPEFRYINDSFGYSKNEVVYTGLARFDDLHDFKTKKYILLMPTWRVYLNKLEEDFINSDYYNTYQSLISSSELISILDRFDYHLIFYPHYEIQKHKDKFNIVNDRIIFADKETYDVQQLLKESKLLVTDYSSVFFDFAYMKKPTVFYQFDKNLFFENHYQKGYFDYTIDGFGPVVDIEDECIKHIEKYFLTKFKLDGKYEDRVNRFFKLRDKENCKRIYDEICKLK